MTTINEASAALTNNLSSLREDLTDAATKAGAAAAQYKQLTKSKQEAEIGSVINGLNIVGSSKKRLADDGTKENVGIATFGENLGTFGSLTSQTGGALLAKTVTGASADAADAAFRNTFSSALSEREMFLASVAASEALADPSILPAGASTASLITDAAQTITDIQNKMLQNSNFAGSILENITGNDDLVNTLSTPSVVEDIIGIPSIPVIDYQNVPPQTILQTFEETEAYIRSSLREITEVVVHATDTTRDVPVDYSVLYFKDTDRGFSDVGYHLLILRNGGLQVCRSISKVGAHCLKGHNRYSIGIAFVGGLEGNRKQGKIKRSSKTFTNEQWNTFNMFMKAFYTVIPGGQAWGHNSIEPQKKPDPYFDVPAYISARFGKENTQSVLETRQEGALSIAELIQKQYKKVFD